MFDNRPTRNQFGANNTRDTETFSDQFVEDRTKVHEFNNDFDEYNTGNYTVSGTGGTTFTSIAGDGGIIQAVTAASGFYSLQNVRATFQQQLGYRKFAEFILSVDSSLANILVGLLNTTATPFTVASQTDGMYFTSSGTALSINVAVGGVITTVNTGAVLVPGLTNYLTLKLFWDAGLYALPQGRVVWEASGAGVVVPVRGEVLAPANYPGATLTNITVGVQASTAAARTMNLDLISVIKDRVNVNATPTF